MNEPTQQHGGPPSHAKVADSKLADLKLDDLGMSAPDLAPDAECEGAECEGAQFEGAKFERELAERYQRLSLLTLDLAEEAGEAVRDFARVDLGQKRGRFDHGVASMTKAIWAHTVIERLRKGGGEGVSQDNKLASMAALFANQVSDFTDQEFEFSSEEPGASPLPRQERSLTPPGQCAFADQIDVGLEALAAVGEDEQQSDAPPNGDHEPCDQTPSPIHPHPLAGQGEKPLYTEFTAEDAQFLRNREMKNPSIPP